MINSSAYGVINCLISGANSSIVRLGGDCVRRRKVCLITGTSLWEMREEGGNIDGQSHHPRICI